MKINFNARISSFWSILALVAPMTALSAPVVGGSQLVAADEQSQLQNLIGMGELNLINIFTKTETSDGNAFHAAVDGKGMTITVMHVTNGLGQSAVIGGFNPQSWSSIGDFNTTPLDSQRTAFLFDLTNSKTFNQSLGEANAFGGFYQTYNVDYLGPTFGAGYDLWVSHDLTHGSSSLNSYALQSGDNAGFSIIGDDTLASQNLTIDKLEVFSVSAVPEPDAYLMMLLGAGMLAYAVRRKQSA